MGTIADKLNYLNNTKAQIKNEINKIGGNITNETTFRDYVSNMKSIYDKLPKVEGSGSDITLNDTEEALLSLTPEGYASQEKTTGKNLIPTQINEWEQGTFVVNDGSNYPSTTRLRTKKHYLISTGEYSFSIQDNNYSWVNVMYYDANKNFLYSQGSISSVAGLQDFVINITNSNVVYFRATVKKNDDSTIVSNAIETIKPIIELGAQKTNWEPYTSGQPSPNPEYPQPIKVVTGEQNIEIKNKNLLKLLNINSTFSGVQVTVNSDKSITLNGTCTSNYAINIITNWSLSLENGKTYTLSGCPDLGGKDTLSLELYSKSPTNQYVTDVGEGKTFTLTADRTYRCYIAIKSGQTYDNVILYPMVEEGSTATEYEPYQSQNYPLSLGNIELARINDYKDCIFKNELGSKYYNADLEEDSWYVGKQIKKLIFDGTQKIHSISVAKTQTTRVTYQSFAKKSVAQVLISNRFDGYNNKYNGDSTSIAFNVDNGDNTDLWFRILKTTIGTTKEEINQWLSENNIVVYFPIVTSYEKITDTTLIQQLENMNNNARSYKGTTIIECSSASEENETLQVSTVALKDLDLLNTSNDTLSTTNTLNNIQPLNTLDNTNEIDETEEPIEEYEEL